MRSRAMWLWPVRWLGIAGTYFGVGRLSLLDRLTIDGATVAPMWPPTGFALGVLLLLGMRAWPGVTLGSLLIFVTESTLRPGGLAIVVGGTVTPLLGCWLLRRAGFRVELDRLRDGLSLVFLGAIIGVVPSPSLGASVQRYRGGIEPGGFWEVWSVWWAGEAIGVLVVAPLVLLIARAWRPMPAERSVSRIVEGTLLAGVVLGVTPLITFTGTRLLFVMFPMVIWSALRFRLLGAAPATLYTSVLVTDAATSIRGLFAVQSVTERVWFVQAFNGALVLTALLLSALVTEQLNVRLRIEQVCFELAEVVDYLTPGASAAHWPLREKRRPRGSTEL